LVANTEAMLIAGLERVSNDPDGGRIDRDTSGQPTGLFIELAAMNLVLNMVPAYTTKQWEQGIREGMAEWNRYGVTATKENYPRVQFELLEIAYGALLSQGEMTIRNWLIPRAEWATEVRDYGRQPADLGEHLKVGGVKFFLDGSLAGRTAWLNDPYLPASPSSGLEYGFPQIDVDEFARAVEDATLAAIPVCVHAIGDRASDIAIEEFRRVSASHGANDIGHTLIHGLLLSEPAIFKMAELRLLLETQTPFLPVLGQAYARVIPPERLIRVIPLQSLLSNGVCVGNGSDAPTCSPDPRLGMWAAVTRSSVPNAVEDREFGRAEGVDLLKGLRTYTALAARCVGREQEIGTIEPGKRADLVIWGSDWLAGDDPAALLQAPVDATIVGGETVFLRRGAAPLDPVH
jgi:predicted amidohydrolase YtcJ